MILRDIYLYPDLVEYPISTTSIFRYQTRNICNYLERVALKSLKFKTNDFRRICIIGKSSPNDTAYVNSSNVLGVDVKFNEKEYLSLNTTQLNEYFIELLKDGINKINEHIQIPKKELLEGIESFRLGGYKNRWTQKTKQMKSLGLKCHLNCNLTMDNFHLSLLIFKAKELIFEKEILKTKPDEIMFERLLNDVKLIDDKIVVLGKRDKIVYELDVKNIKI